MYKSRISGLGHFLPPSSVTNQDLGKLMDTSDEWIQERTGIKSRRWVDPNNITSSSQMGYKASLRAIATVSYTHLRAHET